MQGLFCEPAGCPAQASLEFFVPDGRRRIGVVSYSSKHLEEMPISLKFIVIIPVLRLQQVEWLFVMWLGLHFCGQRFIHFLTIAIIKFLASHGTAGSCLSCP